MFFKLTLVYIAQSIAYYVYSITKRYSRDQTAVPARNDHRSESLQIKMVHNRSQYSHNQPLNVVSLHIVQM